MSLIYDYVHADYNFVKLFQLLMIIVKEAKCKFTYSRDLIVEFYLLHVLVCIYLSKYFFAIGNIKQN